MKPNSRFFVSGRALWAKRRGCRISNRAETAAEGICGGNERIRKVKRLRVRITGKGMLMFDFRPLTLEDRDLFRHHTQDYPFKTYEYSFATLYLWRQYCDAQIAERDGCLLIRKTCKFLGTHFMQPVGYKKHNLPHIIEHLVTLKKETPDMRYLLGDVEEAFLQDLLDIYGQRVEYAAHVENFDYIYKSSELIELKGRRFHSKKNHLNRFLRDYEHRVVDVSAPTTIKDCIEFSERWFSAREPTVQLVAERQGVQDVLADLDYLGLEAMAVYVDDKMAGFTVGEKVNRNMAVIHVEKGDTEYRGIYAFINQAFVERYFSDVPYINREEDLGIEGIRQAKMSYNPVWLEKKYLVNLD